MAKKESITRDYLFKTAFQMAREEGMEKLTARKLAARAGCSTQPIFRIYENMEELWQEVFEKASEFFEEFYSHIPGYDPMPFVNLGAAYIRFAMEERNLFQILFLSQKRYGKSIYEILNGKKEAVGKEVMKAKNEGCENTDRIFMKMWIFIHGAACMSITGDYHLEIQETIHMLKEAYVGFRT